MTGLYLGCLLVIAAAAAGTVWLKRVGDRTWAEHQTVGTITVTLTIDTSGFEAALREASLRWQRLLSYQACPLDGHGHDWRDCPTPEDIPASSGGSDA